MHRTRNNAILFSGLMIGILLIGIASATYPGETVSWKNELSTTDISYHFAKNLTALPGIIVKITSTKISATIPANMPPCNFDIVFVKNEQEKEDKDFFWWFQMNKKFFIKHFQINEKYDYNKFYNFFRSFFRR